MLKKIINFGIYLTVFCLPFYLIRFKINWIPFNLIEIIIGILFLFWLANALKNKELRCLLGKIEGKLAWPIFLIFSGTTLATLFSVDLEATAGAWKGWLVVPLIFLLILITNIQNKKQLRNILISLASSGIVVSLIAFFYWLQGNVTYNGRLNAFYLSPNYLAMYLSPILIFLLYFYFVVNKKILNILIIIGCFLLSWTIYLTYSHGAWFGLMSAFLFLFIIFISQKHIFWKNKKILGILFLAVFLFLVLQVSTNRFDFSSNLPGASLEPRLIIWKSAAEIIKDNYLLGIGPRMFQEYYLNYQEKFPPYLEWAVPHPHNIFLAFWLQSGLIGLIGFIWLLVSFFKQTKNSQLLNYFLLAAMIYILVHGLLDTTYWKNDLSIVFWLIIALNYKANRLTD